MVESNTATLRGSFSVWGSETMSGFSADWGTTVEAQSALIRGDR